MLLRLLSVTTIRSSAVVSSISRSLSCAAAPPPPTPPGQTEAAAAADTDTDAGAAATAGASGAEGAAAAARSAAAVDAVDCVIVGAGVVGLAIAGAAARCGLEVILLESQSTFGTITSSRHSEVIHAGIYYPRGSNKASLCVEGKALLYEYCRDRGVPHKRLGKLIVAASEQQLPKLKALQQSAAANGVPDLQLLSGQEACSLEPSLSAAAALLSPSTGILDSHAYMEALLADAEAEGAVLSTHSKLLGAKTIPGSIAYSSSGGSSTCRPLLQLDVLDTGSGHVSQLSTHWLVNAAGLSAQVVAASISPRPAAIPQQHLAKGNYFSLACRAPFSRLMYPMPEDGGLGVHLTLDLSGQARFGPDVEWVSNADDYNVDPARAEVFYPAIRTYYPGLPDGALQPSYSGIRPKLSGPGQPAADFVLQGERDHGVVGLVNLYGIESPGLTSSLAIAQAVVAMLRG